MSILDIAKSKQCTGCGACEVACPKKCIGMGKDQEGFLFPNIDIQSCIKCGKCLTVCPVYSSEKQKSITAFAALFKNTAYEKNSSSGGIFPLLSIFWIANGGYVCAAKMGRDHMTSHVLTNKVDTIGEMQGSKYVQSQTYSAFQEAGELLRSGERILFFGTPCQVAAFKKLFRIYADRIAAVDLICHGVPSPAFFAEYIEKVYEAKHSVTESIRFREKTKSEANAYRLVLQDGKHKRKIDAVDDAYFSAFLTGKNFRESCYICGYASPERAGDITIGDCNTSKLYKGFPYGSSISAVLINSEKGQELWNAVKNETICCKLDLEREIAGNHQLHAPFKRSQARDEFYSDWNKLPVKAWCRKYRQPIAVKRRIVQCIKRMIPLRVKYKLKKVIGKCE